MKKVYVMLCLLLFASASFAGDKGDSVGRGKGSDSQSEQSASRHDDSDNGYNDNSVVRWKRIDGVITALNVNNPVGNINSGTFPWATRGGQARVNLSTGATSFDVDGLVINGATFSGTPGPVVAVTGTLVCNPGDATGQAVLDTAVVPLSQQGDAHFFGRIDNIPASCVNPLFLVRIATPAGAAGLWIATGAERFIGNNGK